jgi:hypothetical protein
MMSPSYLTFTESVDNLFSLTKDWICYWNKEIYGFQEDTSGSDSEYTFLPSLKLGSVSSLPSSTFVFSDSFQNKFYNSTENRNCFKNLHNLYLPIRNVLHCLCGSEADEKWYPIIVPPGTLFTPESVLDQLGAHPKIQSSVVNFSEDLIHWDHWEESYVDPFCDICDDDDRELLEKNADAIWNFIGGKDKALCFYAGSDLLNPVPLFILGKISSSLIGGFMSVVIHT